MVDKISRGITIIHVAIIEDDPAMQNLLADAVRTSEDMHLVDCAANIATATRLIEKGGYDVLLCDLGLPDGNGSTLIRQEACTGRDTDILVITIFANQNKVLEAIQAGARGYLLKDERIEDCMDAVRNIRKGGSPISPIIARQLLGQIKPKTTKLSANMSSILSQRENEILHIIARGFSNSECADMLEISVNTVATHIKNIYRKLEVNNRTEALFEASSKGLLSH